MATTMPHHSTSWRHAIFVVFAFAFAFTASQAVLAQQFPDRPITLLVPYAAGGPADQHMRALVDDASKALGQNVVVQNVPGASGMNGALALTRAAPDGSMLSMLPPPCPASPRRTSNRERCATW